MQEPAFDPELYFNKIPALPKPETLELDENGELIENKKRKGKEKYGKDKKVLLQFYSLISVVKNFR